MSHIIARVGAGAALALTATTLAAPTAHAAVGAPSGLSVTPEGASIPALAWTPVPTATGYQVQVDNDSGFGSPEFTLSTVNYRATPTTPLRSGAQFWRVRAVKSTDTSEWREGNPFNVAPVSVPVPVSPESGANLAQPGNPPLLQWQGSPGATSYTVEVDGDVDFVGSKSYTTKATSLVVPDPLGEGDWFWRVTAVKSAGLVSLPSAALGFNILPLAKPALISPADSVDTKVSDVVLDWEPVPGARTYDVQISDGPTFDPGSTTSAVGIQGTRFSPATTLNNDQFWWRVRAIDLNGQATTWAQTNFGFNRVFEHQSQAVYPLGSYSSPAPLTTSRPYYQWTPVPQASDYELLVANDINFSVNARSCRTSGTTYTPRSATDCGYKSTGTTYWMVRPLDKPYESTGLPGQLASIPQAITWTDPGTSPATFDPSAEVQGMKVSVNGGGAGCASNLCDSVPTTPVFSWDPMPGATSYLVYVGQDNKFTTSVLATRSLPVTTTNTMMSLEWKTSGNSSTADQLSTLPDSSAGQAYHWYVRACGPASCGPHPVSSPFTLSTKAFRKVSPPVSGLNASSGAGTEITFSWQDYLATNLATSWLGETGNQSARGYHIQVDTEPSFQAPLLDDQVVDQTTYTAWDKLYPEGTLYWRVQATDSEGQGLSWSATQSLAKESPAVQLQAPAHGATVSGTVPLRWAPQAFAASYTVEVYKNNDRSFSAVNRLFSATVKTPAYAWTQPIPADPTSYVWRVRRTDADGNPGPWSTPFEFVSRGAAPVLTSPANGSWQPGAGTLFTWTDVPGAASYSIIATSGSGSRLVSASTTGNAYATVKAVPTGTYTWNVTALDAAGRVLGTSTTGSFRVDGTAPAITSMKPAGQAKRSSVFVVKFSEKVKGASAKTIKLYQKGKKKPLRAKVAVKGGTKATLDPKGKLMKGKTYLVKIAYTKIKDEAGNALVKPGKWTVTVK